MLRWLLRLLLTVVVARLVMGALRPRTGRPGPQIDPAGAPPREKSRAPRRPRPDELSPHAIEDAEYEDLPGKQG